MAIIVKKAKLNVFEKVYIFEIARGIVVTIGHFCNSLINPHRLPTLNYPEQKRRLLPNYRGRLRLLKNETGELKCTACLLCVKACPANCLTVEAAPATPGAKRTPARYDLDVGRCIFCGLCVEACPFGAIDMNSGIYELADKDPARFIFTKEKLAQERGPQ
ncbi:MAG: NADH-quinone oxidoreductase subunit I [Chitinivibrionales bacterium]|nr:NADH-quinone oxidoreductase subunit I [Chitinivibrionales bacterium]